jgi:hypothetical protein
MARLYKTFKQGGKQGMATSDNIDSLRLSWNCFYLLSLHCFVGYNSRIDLILRTSLYQSPAMVVLLVLWFGLSTPLVFLEPRPYWVSCQYIYHFSYETGPAMPYEYSHYVGDWWPYVL